MSHALPRKHTQAAYHALIWTAPARSKPPLLYLCFLLGTRRVPRWQGRLVRGRLVIDGTGLGLGLLSHLSLIKSITSMGKAYFPETTASATIINAPW